jgi:uncharacterized membrane protein
VKKMNFVVYALSAVGLASIGQVLLKLGVSTSPQGTGGPAMFAHVVAQLVRSPMLWMGLLRYGGSTILWMMALSTTRLNRLYPFTALTFALVMVLSRLLLKESMSVVSLIGCLIVVFGLYLVVRG